MSPDLAQKEISLISFTGNLENIGDIIDKLLMELARKEPYQGGRFSEAGGAELIGFHSVISKNLETSEIHLDVLTNLKRISSHVTALVFPILEEV